MIALPAPSPRASPPPSYPRALALATALLASSCAIYPLDEQPLSPEGDIAIPFDSGPGDGGPADAKSDAKPDANSDASETMPDPAGDIAYPFDSGPLPDAVSTETLPPDTGVDAGETSTPDPAGDIAYPYDDGGPGGDSGGSGG